MLVKHFGIRESWYLYNAFIFMHLADSTACFVLACVGQYGL